MAARTSWVVRGLLCAVLLAAGPSHAHRLAIQVFSTAQGLPRNSTTCLVPDTDGLLWICTSEGLVRFDGSEFRTFDTHDGLPSMLTLDFLVARDGGYWALTSAGLCHIPAGARTGESCRIIVPVIPGEEFGTDSIAETPDGTLWMVTNAALYRVGEGSHKAERVLAAPKAEGFETVGRGPSGTVLVGSDHALYLWDGKASRKLNRQDCGFGAMQYASDSDIWISTACGLYRIAGTPAGGDLQAVPATLRGWTPGSPGAVVRRRDGTLWLSVGPNLVRGRLQADGSLEEQERFGAQEGVPHEWIVRLTEDSQGNLWGSTEGIGVFRVARSGFQSYYENDGLGSARISSIFEDLAGDICVTTSIETAPLPVSHLKVKRGDRFETVGLRPAPGFQSWGWGWNQFGLQARGGDWWFPSQDGLYRYSGARAVSDLTGRVPTQVFRRDGAGVIDGVFRVFEDSHGNIWFSLVARHQLIRWDRATGSFRRFTAAEGWPVEGIATVIREAADGTIWVGTFNEVLRLRGGSFETVGIASRDDFSVVRDILFDRGGRAWVATANTGLYRSDNPTSAAPVFRRYSSAEGLSTPSIRALAEDNAGLIYVGTVRGVDRIDPAAPVEGGNVRHYTAADGLPDAEENVALRDRRGHLWFGTLHGLSEFDPAADAPQPLPRAYVRRLRVRGEEIHLPWAGINRFSLDLAPDKNQIEIEYAAADLRTSSLRYQYRMQGVDSDWSVPSTEFKVNYANLPPGTRSFAVRAVGPGGEIGASPAVITLSLAAPVWRRWWFVTLAAMLITAIAYWLYNYRVQHLLAVERLRTRIATDLHDDIGSSLTQISLLSEVGQRDLSRNVLAEIAQISRDLGREMADIVWAVSPRHDRFEALAHRMRGFAEDALPDGELAFDTTGLPGDLSVPIECRRPIFLVFKEAVNNVARHSRATRLTVRLTVNDGLLRLLVEDDGVGFDPRELPSGEGLNSIRRRVKNLGGSAEWDTSPGRGTRFRAAVPIRK